MKKIIILFIALMTLLMVCSVTPTTTTTTTPYTCEGLGGLCWDFACTTVEDHIELGYGPPYCAPDEPYCCYLPPETCVSPAECRVSDCSGIEGMILLGEGMPWCYSEHPYCCIAEEDTICHGECKKECIPPEVHYPAGDEQCQLWDPDDICCVTETTEPTGMEFSGSMAGVIAIIIVIGIAFLLIKKNK